MENERTCVDLRVRRESEELHYRHAPWYMEDGSTFSPLFYLCPSSYADCGWHQEGPEAGLGRPAPIHDTQPSSYSFTIYTRFLLLFFSFWKISFLNLFFSSSFRKVNSVMVRFPATVTAKSPSRWTVGVHHRTRDTILERRPMNSATQLFTRRTRIFSKNVHSNRYFLSSSLYSSLHK